MKKLTKRIIALVSAMITALSIMFSPITSMTANANVYDGQNITLSAATPLNYSIIGINTGWSTSRYYVTDTEGNNILAYCIEPAKGGPASGTYTGNNMGTSWPLMSKVMYWGVGGPGYNTGAYSLKNYYPGWSDDQLYVLTHIALGYSYFAYESQDWNSVMYGTGCATQDDFDTTHPVYGPLVTWLREAPGATEIPASASKSSIVCDRIVTINGVEYAISSESIQVKGRTSLPSNVCFVKNYDGSGDIWGGGPFDINNTVYVARKLSTITPGASNSVSLSTVGIRLMSIATGGTTQTMAYYYPATGSTSFSITYNTTARVASLELSKTGLAPTSLSGTAGNYTFAWTNQGVAGAKYGMYVYTAFTDADGISYAKDNCIATATTGAGGKITIENIPVSGDTSNDQQTVFYLKEISPAPGYKLDNKSYGLRWNATDEWSGTIIDINGVANVSDDRITTEVNVPTKVNMAGNPVAGATMGIYTNESITIGGTTLAAGTLIRTAVTGTDGKANIDMSDLPYGKSFYYCEITPPAGYKLNTTDKFTFVMDGTTQTGTSPIVEESDLGIITIKKTGDDLVGVTGSEGNYTFTYQNQPLNNFTFEVWTTTELTDAATGWVFPANTKIATATTGTGVGTVYTSANPSTGQNVEISSSDNGQVTINNLIFGTYKIIEVDGKEGFIINGNQTASTTVDEPAIIVTFDNERKSTSIEDAVKIDEAGNPVSNATFGLYNRTDIKLDDGTVILPAQSLIATCTTGADGKISFAYSNLPYGYDFYFKETQQPTGMTVNNSEVSFSMNGVNQTLPNVINTAQYGIIKISKSGDALTGVTGSEGSYSFTYGTVNLNGFTYDIYANENITSAKGWNFTNGQKIASVTTGNTSACVSYVNSGSLVITFTTDALGNIVVNGLPLGSYRIEETSGMPGYVIEGSNIVTVAGNDTGLVSVTETTGFLNKSQDCKVVMTKKDETTTIVLAGAEFTLYAAEAITLPDGTVVVESGKAIETITTDATGNASFTAKLPYGFKYIVRETKAPEGYYLTDYTFEFTFETTDITAENVDLTTGDATANNKHVTGEIEIKKNDSDLLTNVTRGGATLNGAVYEIYADGNIMMPDKSGVAYADGELIAQLVTGLPDECVAVVSTPLTFTSTDDGQIKVSGLYLGNYIVKETIPSTGYLLDENTYNVSLAYVDDKTPVIAYVVTSIEKIMSEKFYIYKKGTDGSESERIIPVKDAEFKLYLTDGLTKNGDTYKVESTSYAVHKMWKTGNEDDYVLVASQEEETAMAAIGFDNSEEYVLISDDKGYLESGFVPYGSYILHETKIPSGRSSGGDKLIELTENKNTGFWNDSKEEKDYTIYNNTIIIKKNPIKISKYDVTGTKELPGATLRLTDANGNIIDEWISTDEAHVVSGLIVGQTYTLTEIIAPKNYKLATSIQFVTIKDPNNTMHVIMHDEFNLKIRTGEVGLNMWIYFGIMMALIGICAGGVICIRKKKFDVRNIFKK